MKFFTKNSWWMVSILTLSLLILHTLSISHFQIDNVTLVLLLILLVSPFIPQIRKIKMGEFEAEIDPKEIQKVKDEVDNKLPDNEQAEQVPEVQETINNITSLLDSDHILALAKLRIELEKSINKLYKSSVGENYKQSEKIISLGKLIHELTLREVLPKSLSNPLKEILYFCNRAVHGDEVKGNDAKKIVESGVSIYKFINSIWQEYLSKPVESIYIENNELDKYNNLKYRVITIVPYVDRPLKNIRILDQEGLDQLLDGYGEYGEFIIEIKLVE